MKTIFSFVAALIICLQGICQNINDLRKLFEYDKGEDIGLQQRSKKDTAQATIYEIAFSTINAQRVTASLIIPKLNLREFPAVIFLNDASQHKESFLSQALDLANNAFASLIIEALPQRPDIYRMTFHNYTEPRKDFNAYRQAVIDIRRAIDFLEQHPKIDHNRIAFIGNGDGAMTGAIVSGIETRILTYVLVSCTPCYSCILKTSNDPVITKARNSLTTEQIDQYGLIIKPLNPINYLPYHFNKPILFQYAKNDPNFDESSSTVIMQSTKEPRSQKLYNTTSQYLIELPEYLADQKKWLKDHL